MLSRPVLQPASPGTLATGLIGHWVAVVGGGIVPDWSGRGNHGKISGSGVRASVNPLERPGGTYHAGADTSKVIVGTDFTLTFPLSIAAWVRPIDRSNWRQIFSKRDGFSNTQMVWQFDLNNSTGNIRFFHGTTGTDFGVPAPLNRWTHLVVTADGSTDRLYINGNFTTSVANSASLGTGINATCAIGALGGADGETFFGGIYEVRAYNRLLNAGEVRQLYYLPWRAAGQPLIDQAGGGGGGGPLFGKLVNNPMVAGRLVL
jgi:hypothetical protein